MLCDVCEYSLGSFQDTNDDMVHQSTEECLVYSATEGCHLCSEIIEAIARSGVTVDPQFPHLRTRFVSTENPGSSARMIWVKLDVAKSPISSYTSWKDVGTLVRYDARTVIPRARSCPEEPKNRSGGSAIYSSNTGSTETMLQITAWLKQCVETHGICNKGLEETWMPSRLLEISEVCGELRVHLRDRSQLQHARYLTLSHCWGPSGNQKLQLTTKTLKAFHEGIAVSNLKPTFRDMAHLTWQLRFRLMWIDCMCIMQDDKKDWAKESAMMGKVYANSWLNVSAGATGDGHSSLYVDRDGSSLVHYIRRPETRISEIFDQYETDEQCETDEDCDRDEQHESDEECETGGECETNGEYKTYADVETDRTDKMHDRAATDTENATDVEDQTDEESMTDEWEVTKTSLWYHEVEEAPVNRRAWVFQEWILSPRIVHMSKNQALWECRHLRASEVFPNGGTPDRDVLGQLNQIRYLFDVSRLNTQADVRAHWWKIVCKYTTCNITFATDRLIALSGIASEAYKRMQCDYLAGIWLDSLPAGLLWHVPQARHAREQVYVAPSWSWASTKSWIHQPAEYGNFRTYVTMLTYETSLANPADMFGQVTGGMMKLRAPLSTLEWTGDPSKYSTECFVKVSVPDDFGGFRMIALSSTSFNSSGPVSLDALGYEDIHTAYFAVFRGYSFGPEFINGRGYHVEGLLLNRLPSSSYVRIGFASLHFYLRFHMLHVDTDQEFVSQMPYEDITII